MQESDDSAAVNNSGIHDAVGYIKELGIDVFCCKTDIRFAFRILSVSPQDSELLELCGRINTTLIDVCLWVVGLVVRFLKHSAQQ